MFLCLFQPLLQLLVLRLESPNLRPQPLQLRRVEIALRQLRLGRVEADLEVVVVRPDPAKLGLPGGEQTLQPLFEILDSRSENFEDSNPS